MGEVNIDSRSGLLGPVSLSYEFGSFPKNLIPPHIRWDEKKEPKYTTRQEFFLIKRQVRKSKGFDIDFTQFRSVFNYRPVDLDCDEYAKPPETTRELVKRLSQKSLNKYNNEWFTEYEFLNIVKANYYMCSGLMFFITFEVKDPYDYLPKLFQTSVYYYYADEDQYILTRPKPKQNVKCVGTTKTQKRYLHQSFTLTHLLFLFESLIWFFTLDYSLLICSLLFMIVVDWHRKLMQYSMVGWW
ncbi:PREDICTED: uncharacterized protein LOC104754151 [Camelina sativa]|uniref:Uncharacterized protein LOC104754151 n=1 Tax=Camelina sativa TaxID=90675 RepID=A0ABM1R3G3_CAMSA|nr:PREDICTED: uncharacterized protein LOC104754151 [Camelina sativa]